jgi:riboflavin kinase/FMN adenylyltransferase
VVVLDFDEARSKETAEEFVHEVLVDCLNARLVLVGEDFHFGHERRGDVALLRRMGADLGFEVVGLEMVGVEGGPVDDPGARVSSTAIRQALAGGDLGEANHLLGRPHEVRGTVVEGDRRGREWGFPTANVSVPDNVQLPRDGIYAVWYRRPDGSLHPGAASLGRRPTIYDDQPYRLLEVHLLDGDDFDLYGEAAAVRFVARVRDELRFDTVEELVAQIGRDVEECRRLLGVQ